jgi:hypothetical protein
VDADINEVLSEARLAFQNHHFALALKCYEYFFDHALDNDPYSLYGVRLSYCLGEWAELGADYPPALQRLRQKADESLHQLTQTRNPERFHDFISICKYLKFDEKPVRQFLFIHASDSLLAMSISRFIWAELVQNQLWEVCNTYLVVPVDKYKNSLMKFDELLKFSKEEPDLCDEDFELQMVDGYVRDVANIILVLLHNNREGEVAELRSIIMVDMAARNSDQLVRNINDLLASRFTPIHHQMPHF